MDYIYYYPIVRKRNGLFEIVVDIREKKAWLFEKYWNLINFDYCKKTKSKTADYTIKGAEDYIAIERKSLKDFLGTLSLEKTKYGIRRRDRFELELERMQKAVQNCYVICEAPISRILQAGAGWKGQLAKALLLRAIVRLKRRYPKIKWEFYENRDAAEARAFYLLLSTYKTLRKKGLFP